jgi:membrane protein required for colicin V production
MPLWLYFAVMNFPLQPYDIFMLAVLALCILHGVWRGMAWEVASLASIIVSGMVAARLSGPLAPYLSAEAPWNHFLAMLVLYVVTCLAIWLAFRVVSDFINRVRLKEFDRQLGGVLGAAKGVLWCIVITFFAVTLSEPARQTILKSRSGHFIAVLTQRAVPILPAEVRAILGKYIDELDRKLDPQTPPEPPAKNAAPGAVAKDALSADCIKVSDIVQIEMEEPTVPVKLADASGAQPISGRYLVGLDGAINLRKYGVVKLAGRTVTEAQLALKRHLAQFLDSPEPSVEFVAANGRSTCLRIDRSCNRSRSGL